MKEPVEICEMGDGVKLHGYHRLAIMKALGKKYIVGVEREMEDKEYIE